MDALALLGLVIIGFLIAVPWVAFSASGRANDALAGIARQQAEIDELRSAVAALRRALVERGQPEADSELAATQWSAHDTASPADAFVQAEATLQSTPDSPPEPVVAPPPPRDAFETPSPPAEEIEPLAEAARDAKHEPEVFPQSFEAQVVPPPPPPMAAIAEAPLPPPVAPRRDFEEAIGSRWAVWVGGIALAFGGLFLVRYSIEAGVFGPGVRLLMGAAFSLLAAAASEYLRRTDRINDLGAVSAAFGRLGGANIPGVLAGVSVLSGFGVVFAAHAIYGFIGPGIAFALMGLIGLAALAASLVHGPVLGLFGLVGSYATPMLVASTAPSYASLSIFIAFVTTTAFLLHAWRPSRVVTLGAVAGHGIWTLLIALAGHNLAWASFLLSVGAVLALVLLKEWPAPRGRSAQGVWTVLGFDAVGLIAIAVPLVLSGIIWTADGGPVLLHAAILISVLVAVLSSARHRDLAPLAPLAAAAAAGMVLLWPSREAAFGISPLLVLDLIRLSFTGNAGPGIGWTAALLALLVGGLPFHALLTRKGSGAGGFITRGCLAFASALGPICLLLAAALRSNGFERSTGFAALSLLLSLALFGASEMLLPVERRNTRSRTNPLAFIGSAAYAAGGAIALGMAVAFALRETWLVVGLAIAAAGVAIIASLRPIPLLRSMSAALATAAFARLIWQPIVTDMGSWPIVNWVIPAYAGPALCFVVGALALRAKQDRPRSVHEALAAFFGAAFVLLEIRQFFAGPDLVPNIALIAGHYAEGPRNRLFEEAAMHAVAIGFIGAGLQLLARRLEHRSEKWNAVFGKSRCTNNGLDHRSDDRARRIFGPAADIAAAALIVLSLGGLCGLLNPLFDGTLVLGPPVFNRLMLYVLAGLSLGVLGFVLDRGEARSRIGESLTACAAVLVSLGAILIVRHAFSGPQMAPRSVETVGFVEGVIVTLMLLALTAAARIWHMAASNRVTKHAMRALAFVAIGWALLALGIVRNPIIDHSGVSGPIIFNRILWGYGAATLAFAGLAFWTRSAGPAISQAFAKTAIGAAVLCAFLLLRHGFHGPQLVSEVPLTLAESGWYASLGFIAAIAIMIAGSVRLLGHPIKIRAESAAIAACAAFGLLSGLIANPLLTEAPLAGPIIFDNALVGYLMPSLLAFAAARWTREYVAAPMARRIFGATAIIGSLIYVLIEVRRWFVGVDLLADGGSATELYAYSVAILLYGIALLALGFRSQSKDLRLASLAVVTVAICKAFLVDMSGLEGLLRALSFIGLGASLVGIGLAYQRLLRREFAQQETVAGDSSVST